MERAISFSKTFSFAKGLYEQFKVDHVYYDPFNT